MTDKRELVETLLGNPAWRRILATFTRNFHQRGRVCGRHSIADQEEADAAWGLLGAPPLKVGKRLTAEKLDSALQRSALGCSLEELLHMAAGETIVPRPELRREAQAAWESTIEYLALQSDALGARDLWDGWVDADRAHLRNTWAAESAEFASAVITSLKLAVHVASDDFHPDSLPVVATAVCGMPKGLDRDQLAGRLALRLLIWRKTGKVAAVTSNSDRADLLRFWKVEVDDLSSVVLVLGLQDGHALVRAAAEARSFAALTLYHIREMADVHAASSIVWVVENPAVFRAFYLRLLNADSGEWPCIVLASGAPSLAVQQLMDRIVASSPDVQVAYSGDNDPTGLALLAYWQGRYPGRVIPWGMRTETGLAPVCDTPETFWQEDLINHLWEALAGTVARASEAEKLRK